VVTGIGFLGLEQN
jgi:hypothetical protein